MEIFREILANFGPSKNLNRLYSGKPIDLPQIIHIDSSSARPVAYLLLLYSMASPLWFSSTRSDSTLGFLKKKKKSIIDLIFNVLLCMCICVDLLYIHTLDLENYISPSRVCLVELKYIKPIDLNYHIYG